MYLPTPPFAPLKGGITAISFYHSLLISFSSSNSFLKQTQRREAG